MNFKKIYVLFAFMIGLGALQSASHPTADEVLSTRCDPQDRGAVVLTLQGTPVNPSTQLRCDGSEFVFKGYHAPNSFRAVLNRLKEAKMPDIQTGLPTKPGVIKPETIIRLIQQGSTASKYDSTVSRTQTQEEFFTADEILTTYRDAIAFCLINGGKDNEILPVTKFLATTDSSEISLQDLPFHNGVIIYAYNTTDLSNACSVCRDGLYCNYLRQALRNFKSLRAKGFDTTLKAERISVDGFVGAPGVKDVQGRDISRSIDDRPWNLGGGLRENILARGWKPGMNMVLNTATGRYELPSSRR